VHGLAVMATGLLQRVSGLYGLDLGLAGSSWDWCASTGALRFLRAWPDPTRTGVSAAAAGRQPSLVVEEGPSRTDAVLLAPIHATFHRYRAGLIFVTVVRR
jgi:hypothetical protein